MEILHCWGQRIQLAFMMAAKNGHLPCVLLLLANGAGVNIANKVIKYQGIAFL
jgi:hypothetical protein